jgi:hypothetical protein
MKLMNVFLVYLVIFPITIVAMKPAGLGADKIGEDIVQRIKETRGQIRKYDSLSIMKEATFHLASDNESYFLLKYTSAGLDESFGREQQRKEATNFLKVISGIIVFKDYLYPPTSSAGRKLNSELDGVFRDGMLLIGGRILVSLWGNQNADSLREQTFSVNGTWLGTMTAGDRTTLY